MRQKLKKWIKDNCIDRNNNFQGRLLFLKKETKEYEQINKELLFLNNNSSISEHVYCIMHDVNHAINICINGTCLKKTNYINYKNGYSLYCSKKCASSHFLVRDKIKKTCLDKYGVEHSFQSEDVKHKIKKTCLDKYGVEYVFQSEDIKRKIKETNIKKYGVENPMQSDIVKEKIKETNIKKYGVEYPMQYNEIKQKAVSSIKKSYLDGTRVKKFRQTCLIKYGVENISQIHLLDKNILDKVNNIEWLKYQHYKLKKSCRQISKELGVNKTSISYFMNKHDIKTNNYICSQYEKEITEFLDVENIQTNNRTIIPPYELDIYLPDYKLAIEFDGIYWHSIKPKGYHLMKTKMCKKEGIQLLHIFENEWVDLVKQEIWKSIISSRLGKNNRIYGRKTGIREIEDNSLVREFLNSNHLQGYCPSSIKLGLFYEDELVSIMTFGKTRFSKEYEYEMIRFCSKKFTSIIGGASKLYKYFVSEYKPKSVVSYADRRYSDGNLYKQLGFEFSHYSNPNYFYFKNGSYNLHSRVKFQKHKLKDLLESYDSSKSEVDNMLDNNYRRIFDCGNAVYYF